MTPEQQRIAIAEACGWTRCRMPSQSKSDENPRGWCLNGLGGWSAKHNLPDYLNDLNAMHDAEKMLTSSQCGRFRDNIQSNNPLNYGMNGACIDWQLVHATASQRAEAFLKTLNLWKP